MKLPGIPFRKDCLAYLFKTTNLTICSTDPSHFSIVVVDNTHYPPVSKTVADNVGTSKGSYTIPPMPGLQSGYVPSSCTSIFQAQTNPKWAETGTK